MKNKTKLNIVLTLLFVIFSFLTVSYFVQKNILFLTDIIEKNYTLGLVIFTLVDILSIVIAPVTSIPLIPLASNTYGVLVTAIFYSIGGIIGSIIAFWIGRTYGKGIVKKIVSIEEAEEVSEAINKKNLFFSLILMRIIVPADVLSYALGIFTRVGYGIYISTLIIGTIPGAFYFSYIGSLPWFYQIFGWIAGIIVLVFILWLTFRTRKQKEK